ncbi:Transducin/WD40 repeat-like superfamily protein [Abeliophyllum distichum]|uniref:Transducin/WD40 repeat-like superfamily protein n=1 Tax=Abeliophyllum distichum TaxID=126358 RepID=A0ABD1UF54_9LAMI
MDLLCRAYSTASDEDDDGEQSEHPPPAPPPPFKRAKCDLPNPSPKPVHVYRPSSSPNLPTEAPIPGRYISKRERAALASAPKVHDPKSPPPFNSLPVLGSLSDSDLPYNILTTLRHRIKGGAQTAQTPQTLSIALNGHNKSVNTVQWSRTHAHLLASAGMDHTICIWNVWSRDQKKARVLNFHKAAVKDVKWSQQGLFVLSCGYDCVSRLVDVENGIEVQVFNEDQIVEVVDFHPHNFNLFLSGGSKGLLKLWDIRSGKVVHEYVRSLGPILDVEFTVDGKHLITSSDVSKSNLSENSIIVWDVSRQIPLSNQVYTEAYTCPAIRCHPSEPYFIAQSNGNYIAIFSSRPPFRLDKYKRYESHGVSGFPIKCNYSSDGEIVVSGSSDGCIYFYNANTSELLRKIKAYEQACIDAVFHPVMSNVVATCSWNGEVSVFN